MKRVWLTFDDGPSVYTRRVLDVLDCHSAKALFFLSGMQTEQWPSIAREIFVRGHRVGNHSWSHQDLSDCNAADIFSELSKANAAISRNTGVIPELFRPPYGKVTPLVVEAAKKMSLEIVLWSVDSLDWKLDSANNITERILGLIHSDAVILMHDGCADADTSPYGLISKDRSATISSLSAVLKELPKLGYAVASPQDLVL